MEFLFDLLFQFLGELLVQIVLETLFEFGLHCVRKPVRRQSNPFLAIVTYALSGALAGALSLAIVPTLLITSPSGRLASLVFTPVLAGAAMVAVGARRRRRDQELIRLDRFAYGYLFALAMALVRFQFGS